MSMGSVPDGAGRRRRPGCGIGLIPHRRGAVAPTVAGVSDRRCGTARFAPAEQVSLVFLKLCSALAGMGAEGMLGTEEPVMATVQDFGDLSLFRLVLPPCLTVWDEHEVVLTGHRIGLYTILKDLRHGDSPEEILSNYPSLEPDLVGQVVAFIRTHPTEAEEYRAAYKATLDLQYEEWKKSPMAKRGPTAEELRRRWVEKGLGPLPSANLDPEFDQPFYRDDP